MMLFETSAQPAVESRLGLLLAEHSRETGWAKLAFLF